jgi:integrase
MRHYRMFMFTEPEIISSPDLSTRAYVKVYIDGERHRFYNGKDLGIKCNPNRAKTIPERNKGLAYLQYQLKKKLEKGWQPNEEPPPAKIPPKPTISAGRAFIELLPEIEQEQISDDYKRDLRQLNGHFIQFLKSNSLTEVPVEGIAGEHIEKFLARFKSSPTNYMSRRRTLSALFFRITDKKLLSANPTSDTKRMKELPQINIPFRKPQFREVIDYIQKRHSNLYLCCLLMYGCLLRPHEEVRLLSRGAFDEELTKISLAGDENKGKKIRTVLIPDYVRQELIKQGIAELPTAHNIFSHSIDAFAKSYFSTAWTRVAEYLREKEIITTDHTLYSFRHTAAVNMYMKTKDPYKVQRALGHSSLIVTLVYLRSLGLVVDSSLDDLPELPR